MNRRGFLLGASGILALGAAPAIVRADSLMRIVPADVVVLTREDLADVIWYLDELPPLTEGLYRRPGGLVAHEWIVENDHPPR